MKKSLVALAALAATSAFAQFSIVGVLDVGVKATSHDDGTKKATTVFNNGTATSQFNFKGVEDLGGGMKSGFFFELDVNPPVSLNSNQASNGQAVYAGTPFNGEQYLNLDGGFGSLKIGTPNSQGLVAGVTAQPFGTALGSGYSAGFARLGTAAVSGLNQYVGGVNGTGRIIRHEKSLAYSTPTVAGFTGVAEYAFKNSNSTTKTSNNNGYSAFALKYNQGPLNAIYYSGQETAGPLAAAGTVAMDAQTTPVANALAVNTNVKWNIAAANYNMGATTVYAGFTTTKASDGSEDSKSDNVGLKYQVNGQLSLAGNLLNRRSNLTSQAAAPNAKLTGLGADYALSKMTNVYFRYENVKNIAIASGVGQAQTVNAVGLRVAF